MLLLRTLCSVQLTLCTGACALLLMSTGVTMAVPASIGYVIDMIYSSAQEGDAADMRRKLTSLVELLIAIFVIGAAANCGRIYLIQTSGNNLACLSESRLRVVQGRTFFPPIKNGDAHANTWLVSVVVILCCHLLPLLLLF